MPYQPKITKEKIFLFCPYCGTERVGQSKFCVSCGSAYFSEENFQEEEFEITRKNFFPRLFEALEDVSIENFFKTVETAKNIFLHPLRYAEFLREGKLAPGFMILVMASLAGAFKIFLHPATKRIMDKFDIGNDVGNAMLQFVLYVFLATFFGYLAVVVARLVHIILRLQVERAVFVYAMVSIFSIVSFVADVLSPFWIAGLESGKISWQATEAVRASITTTYCFLCYRSLRREAIAQTKISFQPE